MTHEPLIAAVREYYAGKIAAHGPTAQGVDWNSSASQHLRFEQLLKICPQSASGPPSVLDYGCGYGALLDYLIQEGSSGSYVGFDICEEMIAVAVSRHGLSEQARFVSERSALVPADYAVASGIFNVKLDAQDAAWEKYVLRVIDDLNELSVRGFAFNILSTHSDKDRRRADLYYADPVQLFRYCTQRFSRYVALLHDYPLYEFTIHIRKEAAVG